MCGIFAYAHFGVEVSMRELLTILINGLQRLEYRGYDSAGLCVDGHGSDAAVPIVVRETGNVSKLREAVMDANAAGIAMDATNDSNVGIAHTRWATHGPPCNRNAHPQSSGDDNEFTIVHNGIITNFTETKEFLEKKGRAFRSDTDTEVVAQLASFLYAKQPTLTFVQLVAEVLTLTQGASAFAFKSIHYPGEMVVCKRGSPLVIGIKRPDQDVSTVGDELNQSGTAGGACNVFVASDTSPIMEHTKHVVFLEDNDIVSIRGGNVSFFNADRMAAGSELVSEVRVVKELEMELEALTKGSYPHFMLKEIHEQVRTVVNSMRGRVNWETGKVLLGGFDQNRGILKTARRIVFISCGTSLNACIAVRPLFDELADCPIAVENASDFLDRKPRMFRDDVVVFVSQSGETADTLRAMEHCSSFGCTLVGFTNTVGSAISRKTHFGAHLNCGLEIGVASTKAFTSQIVTMTLMALMLCDDSIQLAPRRKEILDGLSALSDNIKETLASTTAAVAEIASRVKDAKSVLVLGRGYQFATGLEAALKIKELTYVHTEGMNAGELKHGPLALIDENICVIIICTHDALIERVRSAVQQVKARGGRPIVVLSKEDREIEALADSVIRVPATVDCLQSIVNVVPLHLVAYHTAVLRGNNVDCPRNLAKSVTVQ
jgi:glucosamine--fructose-6-phosphate aminotransferase (isomerizing)